MLAREQGAGVPVFVGMCTETPEAHDRVEAYRQLKATLFGVTSGEAGLDRYARALMRRAEAACEVTSKGLRHVERLCDLNEAGLLDYRGRGPQGVRYALSRAGASVLAASAAPSRRRAFSFSLQS